MQLISSATVGAGGAAQIDITSIPGTFTDLLLVASARSDFATTTAAFNIRLNNQVAAVYNGTRLYGTGSSVVAGSQSSAFAFETEVYIPGSSSTASTFANIAIHLPNYTSSTNKVMAVEMVGEGNITNTYHGFFAGRWNNTAAITQINLLTNGNFVQNSTVYLYGILKGSGGATAS